MMTIQVSYTDRVYTLHFSSERVEKEIWLRIRDVYAKNLEIAFQRLDIPKDSRYIKAQMQGGHSFYLAVSFPKTKHAQSEVAKISSEIAIQIKCELGVDIAVI